MFITVYSTLKSYDCCLTRQKKMGHSWTTLDIIGHFCVTMCYQNRQNVLPLSQFLSLKNFSIMKKNIVTVIYDRKNSSNRRGKGKIEARIYLSRTERKYITLGEATP